MTHQLLKPRVLLVSGFWAAASLASAQGVQNTTLSYRYDANGNLTQTTDALNHTTTQAYDALNRRTTVTDANNGITRFGFNGRNQLVQVTDPGAHITQYGYDGLGNLNQLQSPDTGSTFNTVDAAGNVVTRTDAKGQLTSFQYDALNRVTHIAYADGNAIDFVYDQGANAVGRLSQISDNSGSTQFTYDQKGRLLTDVRTIGAQQYTVAYRYDAAGRLSGMTYPSGRSIDYVRDGSGRISQVSASKGGMTQILVSQAIYQPFGPAKMITYGNGQSTIRPYDLDGRLDSYTLNGQQQIISYDSASRITAVNDAGNLDNSVTYGYDNLDRLTSFLKSTASSAYAYDAVGNRTAQMTAVANTTYTYGATNNRLTQVNASPIGSDANGSIVDNGANQFTYDARGRLVAAATAIGSVQYQINGLGQRVQKITPAASTIFYYDMNGKLIGELSGQVGTDYVYLDDMPVAVLR